MFEKPTASIFDSQQARRFKHEFHLKVPLPPLLAEQAGTSHHTIVYRWNDADNEQVRELAERLVLEGKLHPNSEFFTYVVTVCKSWKL